MDNNDPTIPTEGSTTPDSAGLRSADSNQPFHTQIPHCFFDICISFARLMISWMMDLNETAWNPLACFDLSQK